MKKKKLVVFASAVALASALAAGSALAVPITPSDGSLQTFFNSKSWGLDVVDDQLSMPPAWTLSTASSASHMTFWHEDYTSGISFGVYSSTGELAEVFDGGDTPVAAAVVSFGTPGMTTIQWFDSGGVTIGVQSFAFTGSTFGFYIATGTYGSYSSVLYSDSDLNDLDGDSVTGEDEDVALLLYQPAPGSWVFAGDIDKDGDFSDIVTQAESIMPVPEPATMMLFGSGLIGLAGIARRRVRK